jgi:hypothetical protein
MKRNAAKVQGRKEENLSVEFVLEDSELKDIATEHQKHLKRRERWDRRG